ncbi:MAG: GH32 C-terminal domain-containing protein, partial [Proteobacteria bacterium]|nr:GH32 C-terminal domain-containing protein [Pseudomonadota bacterium]
VRIPPSLDAVFSLRESPKFNSGVGEVSETKNTMRLTPVGEFACSAGGVLPARCKLETKIRFDESVKTCGLVLRMSEDLESGYYVRLEPRRQRLVFDMWPRSGDIPFDASVERSVSLSVGEAVKLKIVIDGSACVVYLDEKVALSTRLYSLDSDQWGAFATNGSAEFADSYVSTM